MKGLIFTYALAYGGAGVALFHPFAGVLIYAAFSILRPSALWPWAVPPGNYSLVVALGMLGGWAAKGLGTWRVGRARGAVLALALFSAWATFSVQSAQADRAAAWEMAVTLLKVTVPIFVGLSLIRSVQQLRALAWVLLLSVGYLALDFNQSYLSGYNRVQYEGFADLDNNGVGVALVTCVGLVFYLAINEARWWLRAAALGAGALIAHAVLLTFSRGGMLAMGISGLVAFVLVPKRPSYYVALLLALLVLARFAGPQVIERFQQSFVAQGQDASADSRRAQWSACMECIREYPLGIGPDQWRLINSRYPVPPGQAAHSTWMQAGVEFGLPGLGCLLLYYLLCMARLRPLTRESTPVTDPWIRHLARMVIASLAGFLVGAQFVTLYKLELPYYVALIGLGALKLEAESAAATPGPPSGPGATPRLGA